jgi:hypothetical protein
MTIAFWALMAAAVGQIEPDEMIAFFPTAAFFDIAASVWRVPIHGWIYEPEEDSLKRAAFLGLLRHALRLEKDSEETELFRTRARLFLVDNQRGKQITISLGAKTYPLGPSEANGHFHGRIDLTTTEMDALVTEENDPNGWISFQAVVPVDDERVFAGVVQVVREDGLSVISDIDDTIKVSHVAQRRQLLRNTFCCEFEAVPGMAKLYADWARSGAVFHYVSASPWQLHAPLAEFCADSGFPRGTFHMKVFRVKDSSLFDLVGSPDELKWRAIEPLLKAWPRRRFICVGDSGERDPEIFAALAREYPEQITRIHIRSVDGDTADAPRFQQAFAGVPRERWSVFRTADELPLLLPSDE